MTQDPEKLASQLESTRQAKGLPPLDKWHPELSGDMDLIITRDGKWLFKGSPIAREEIVRLFSTILRREDDGEYYLVTPVEKWRIRVEDAPLLAHTLEVAEPGQGTQVVSVTTNVGETLEVGAEHPLVISTYPDSDEPRPVVYVRHGVEARLVTTAFYDLVEHAIEREDDGKVEVGVVSHGIFYKIGDAG
ncbi:MAG: DUF1285 domain-containing protein [Gammaproteobacteria bacterium]|uniref:Proteophosphoglycan n=1 Tax=Marinobacter nitratireducens TaxID=1137280 RepID=A0A072N4D0_9GAMM|nr:DUF1285 domain-containing protein [Marinobacter nitratireducens]KEF32381.1 Proteophosphoglycan precursor [Marinobacter nitratireducens]TNE71111.1 MAG: DUF1285 domain-containing protein [Gammaproteobacteria bacterium]